MKRRRALFIRICFAAILASTSPVGAQSPASPAPPTQVQLRNYAAILVELTSIQVEFAPQLEASVGEARVRLERQMYEVMLAAVRRHNLSRRTFNRISAQVEHDPELARQIRNEVGRLTVGY